jgi:hypothetical protein
VGLAGTQGVWASPQLAFDVQGWIDGSVNNYGWILIGDETTNPSAKRFHSADSTTAATGQRPQLTINILPPAGIDPVIWLQY